jgi:hypothetical protein
MTKRTIGWLTQKRIANAEPPEGRSAVMLADGGNLYLQCTFGPGGTVRRSWIFRYETFGRVHDLGLGPTFTVGLREARKRARSLRLQILDGIDPLDFRRATKAVRPEWLAAVLAAVKAATAMREVVVRVAR